MGEDPPRGCRSGRARARGSCRPGNRRTPGSDPVRRVVPGRQAPHSHRPVGVEEEQTRDVVGQGAWRALGITAVLPPPSTGSSRAPATGPALSSPALIGPVLAAAGTDDRQALAVDAHGLLVGPGLDLDRVTGRGLVDGVLQMTHPDAPPRSHCRSLLPRPRAGLPARGRPTPPPSGRGPLATGGCLAVLLWCIRPPVCDSPHGRATGKDCRRWPPRTGTDARPPSGRVGRTGTRDTLDAVALLPQVVVRLDLGRSFRLILLGRMA